MNVPEIKRGDLWWVSLDPTQGSEIRKTRPCLVLTNDTLNRLRRTVVVIPLSMSGRAHPPITVPIICQGRPAVAIVDQIRAVARHRLRSRIDAIEPKHLKDVCRAVSLILDLC